ncbi:MAG TPA: PDZ domain-containing protein [Pyrinomonadaceae bacterium]|jgi:C-terminal processing protease CtpA/Prc|nr:PDZ domain-containing protein [Pyrinomonadaceae bacterium]
MFGKKTVLSLALLLVASAGGARAQEAQGGGSGGNTSGARVFVYGGGNQLGVSVESVTRENMNSFNLSGEPRGVAVREVLADSPAAKAGLQKNDVILRFDGEQVSSVQKLQRLINESAPEHTARLSISRGGAEQELSVTLAKREARAPRAFGNFNFPDGQTFNFDADELKRRAEELSRNSDEWKKRAKEWERGSEEMRKGLEKFRAEGFGDNFRLVYGAGGRRIGITTQNLTDQLANYFGVSGRDGLLVTSVAENSPASKAGLKAGDVVTEVDGTRLKNAGELSRALNRRDEGEVSLTVVRDRKTRTIKVTPDRTQNNPTFYTPGDFEAIAPVALIAPRVHVAPLMPAAPRVTPLVAPRPPQAAPRIYAVPPAAPAVPAHPGVWVL